VYKGTISQYRRPAPSASASPSANAFASLDADVTPMTRALCVGLMTPHESLTDRSPSLAFGLALGSSPEAGSCDESLRPIGRALRRGHESRPLPVLPGNRDMDRALCTKEPYLNTGVATVTGFAGE
jgi:hypothetical protein